MQCQAGLGGLQFVLRGLGMGQQLGCGLVVVTGDAGQHAQLRAADFAVGHGNAGHGGVALDVPAVLQAQRQKLFVGQFAALPAVELVAELLGAQLDELLVELGVLVHGAMSLLNQNEFGARPGEQHG